jgi:DNA-binding NarL/FixJ family response regulator
VDRIHGLDLQRGSGRRPADADILLIAADEADSDLLRWLVLELLDEPTPVLLMLDKPSMTPAWIAWFASSGMVLSSATDQELIDSVRLVLNRCTVLPADVIVAMPSHWRAVFSAYWPFSPETQAAFDALTTRELGVLRLVGLGRRNSEIAAELWLSENTVRSHIRRMQAKLGVRGRLCMIILAHELGVTNIPG